MAATMPARATAAAASRKAGCATARFTRRPHDSARDSNCPANRFSCLRPSKGLQIFDDGVLVARGEIGAVQVTAVAISGQSRVVLEERAPVGAGHVRDEADPLLIEDVVPAVEDAGPALGGLEQIAERRHRAVVQINSRSARGVSIASIVCVSASIVWRFFCE